MVKQQPFTGKDWRQEENRTTEGEIVARHHRLNGYEFEQALGVCNGQGSQACCSPWGCKEPDMTERLNWLTDRFSKTVQQNSAPIYDRNAPENQHTIINNRRHCSQWWKTENISSKIRNKTKVPTLTAIIQHSFGYSSHSNLRGSKNKGIQTGNKKENFHCFADDMIPCIEYSGDTIKIY